MTRSRRRSVQTDGLDEWEEVIDAVHTTQKSRGLNLPFFFNFSIDGYGPGTSYWQTVKDLTGDLWETNPYPPPSVRYWRWVPPQWLKDAINKKSQGGRFPDDAIRILQPWYYPWEQNQWNYTTLPPWFKWHQAIATLNDTFPYATNRDLQIQPVIQSGDIEPPTDPWLPGHADMHKQIRVLLDMEPKNRITALWFIGWTINGNPRWSGDEEFAKELGCA
ncbi:hypothetical protein FJZ36_18635 [Candidatus Poribacteria bacterium]|nr:hypothetical protein [Candidatus Poribacteria bacterium]